MKFIAKQKQYTFVIRPGIPREHLTGRAAVPGIYVRFDDHIANVTDPEAVELLKNSPSYGIDFTSADSVEVGFVAQDNEPVHVLKELKHGSIGATLNAPRPVNVPAEIERRAIEIAQQIAPKIAIEMLKKLQEAQAGQNKPAGEPVAAVDPAPVEEKELVGPAPKRGRPKKVN